MNARLGLLVFVLTPAAAACAGDELPRATSPGDPANPRAPEARFDRGPGTLGSSLPPPETAPRDDAEQGGHAGHAGHAGHGIAPAPSALPSSAPPPRSLEKPPR